MNYQVLARRYRPRRFEEVVGQESIAATLRGGILQERVAHAYLFAGPRGVGKTSMARIFAKALNCPKAGDRSLPKEAWAQPCNECSACEAIHLGQDIDVVELDGASHRGIEDIRTILEGVNRPATKSPFKIYIIDEVHMLTREAFNALLKTLEEPPPHVKFLFATTEPHRIPETVLSRCQRFDFHPIGEEAIVRRLAQILEAEGRKAEPELLERVARYGKGGLRDAQSLLDQLMTFSEDALRLEDLDRITGRVPEEVMVRLAEAVARGDAAEVLRELRESFERGADPAMLLEQLVENFRMRVRNLIESSAGSAPGAQPSLDRWIGCLQILLESAAKLKYSPFAEVSVEVTLLKVARLEEPRALEEAIRVLTDAGSLEGPGAATAEVRTAVPLAAPSRPKAVPSSPAPLDFAHLRSLWDQIRIELEARHPEMGPYLKELSPRPAAESAGLFCLEIKNPFYLRQMKSAAKQQALVEVVREVTGAPWKVSVTSAPPAGGAPAGGARTAAGGASPPPGAAGSPESRASPADPAAGAAGKAARAREPPPAAAPPDGLSTNPIVKKSLDLFGGRLV
jgi:DNA polymerase-3 subunit gamma/tau